MSNISKTQKNLKQKLSLSDYGRIEQREDYDTEETVAHTKPAVRANAATLAQEQASSKIKATYYLSEDDYSALTHVYIKRLQDKKKTDRSALIGEAIRLLYEKEMA
ncbi:MAG TPA: hypothetical protein PKD74_00220 [Candidatus Dependentiae bacterium]|nr:hypothetical protein [Candidatus Dependentiae bacterium]